MNGIGKRVPSCHRATSAELADLSVHSLGKFVISGIIMYYNIVCYENIVMLNNKTFSSHCILIG